MQQPQTTTKNKIIFKISLQPGKHTMSKLNWLLMDTCCTQSAEAFEETQHITDGVSPRSIQAVINASFIEGKTLSVCRVIPAHHVVVQALLNMSPSNIKTLYAISTNIPDSSRMKLRSVVKKQLNPLLLDMRVDEFKKTVELLYFLKEYLLSLYGHALVNLTCIDKVDVVLILSQVNLSCNLCDRPACSTSLFQCLNCSVSSICRDCMQTPKGAEYLEGHCVSCGNIQSLLQPYAESIYYAHLCKECFVPLHKNVTKNHVKPQVIFQFVRRKLNIVCEKPRCLVPKCKRDLCTTCLLKVKK